MTQSSRFESGQILTRPFSECNLLPIPLPFSSDYSRISPCKHSSIQLMKTLRSFMSVLLHTTPPVPHLLSVVDVSMLLKGSDKIGCLMVG